MATEPKKKKPAGPVGKAAFYRFARDWHGYFSAFAFLALMFFAITGLLLNHPDWTRGAAPALKEQTLKLTPEQIAAVRKAEEPGKALVAIAEDKVKLRGEYKAGEVSDPDIFVRMQGARGSSDLRGSLESGDIQVSVETASAVAMLNDLHRGELAGAPWRLFIDIIAIGLALLSILGYILFFSLRFRIKTALIVTAVSLAIMIGLFVAFVP